MTNIDRPGRHFRGDRAGELVLPDAFSNSTASPHAQRHRAPPFRLWTVDACLRVEVRHGH